MNRELYLPIEDRIEPGSSALEEFRKLVPGGLYDYIGRRLDLGEIDALETSIVVWVERRKIVEQEDMASKFALVVLGRGVAYSEDEKRFLPFAWPHEGRINLAQFIEKNCSSVIIHDINGNAIVYELPSQKMHSFSADTEGFMQPQIGGYNYRIEATRWQNLHDKLIE